MNKATIIPLTVLMATVLISMAITVVAIADIQTEKGKHGDDQEIGSTEDPFIPFEEGPNVVYSENSIEALEEPPEDEELEEEPIQWEDPEEGDTWGFGNDPDTNSPEIYFHVNEKIKLDLSVHIKDGVTRTIPEVQMGTSAIWHDVTVRSDGSIHYKGEVHEMLYYEGRFVNAYGLSNMGWVLEKIDEQLYLDSQFVTERAVLDILRLKMRESGLQENEIDFLIHRIVEKGMLAFDTEYLYIRYIPQDSVDEAIKLDVPDSFSLMRRHFLIEASNVEFEIFEPQFEFHSGELLIHETAINRI